MTIVVTIPAGSKLLTNDLTTLDKAPADLVLVSAARGTNNELILTYRYTLTEDGTNEKEFLDAVKALITDADFTAATHKLASMLLSEEDKFMLTVFSGADATAEMRDELSAYLAEAHPDAEVYFIDGEQQIYPFIFAAE